MIKRLLAIALTVLWAATALAADVGTRRALLSGNVPAYCKGMDLCYDYTVPRGTPLLGFPPATDTHASTIYAQQSSGGTWQAFAANVPTRTALGLQTVPTRTNLFLNSLAPVTQTITISNTTQYTVAVYGSGSVTLSGGGSGTATVGSPVTFTSSSTSLTVTVTGSPFCVNVTTGAFAVQPIATTGTSATVNGNQQVIGLTGLLGSGVSGFVQVNVLGAMSNLDNVLNFSDGTTSNRLAIYWNGTNWIAEMTTATVSQGIVTIPGATASGLWTVAYAFGPNFFAARAVGQAAPTADTVSTYPSLTQVSLLGRGDSTVRNVYGRTTKFATKFGPASQSSLDAAYAAAQLAAASP